MKTAGLTLMISWQLCSQIGRFTLVYFHKQNLFKFEPVNMKRPDQPPSINPPRCHLPLSGIMTKHRMRHYDITVFAFVYPFWNDVFALWRAFYFRLRLSACCCLIRLTFHFLLYHFFSYQRRFGSDRGTSHLI